MKSGIFDKNKREIELDQTLRWKHFDGHTRDESSWPDADEFKEVESKVMFLDGAFSIVDPVYKKWKPLASYISNEGEEKHLFNYDYFGSSGEFMQVRVDCDFEIINPK